MNSAENTKSPSENVQPRKIPFNRIRLALDQIVTVAVPLHVQLLKEQSEKINQLKITSSPLLLHAAQLDAAKALRLLKADLYDLEQLNDLVEDKDKDLFYSKIKTPIKEAVETLSNFMILHPDALEPFFDIAVYNATEFPNIVCNLEQECEVEEAVEDCGSLPVVPLRTQVCLTSKSAFPDWSFLKKELIEVHSLITRFTSLVFSQKESVNTIQNNVEETHGNVLEGVTHLRKASVLKAATFPLAGAIVGGVLLGPVGAFVGFKLLGTAACVASGGVLGYGAGMKLKKKHEISCDIEMKALTYNSKTKSTSNPELPTSTDNS